MKGTTKDENKNEEEKNESPTEEENLPFILSSDESDTDTQLLEIFPSQVNKRRCSTKFNKATKTKDKPASKETFSPYSLTGRGKAEVVDEDESEIKRNKWRTVVINVGGVSYRSKISNFSKFPASRLGKIFRARSTNEILEFCDGYKAGNPPIIFFDRNDQNFSAIIDSYRMDELHVCAQNCSLVTQVTQRSCISTTSINYFRRIWLFGVLTNYHCRPAAPSNITLRSQVVRASWKKKDLKGLLKFSHKLNRDTGCTRKLISQMNRYSKILIPRPST